MFCRVWALPRLVRLRQVLPFHEEPKQLDVQLKGHGEEGVFSGKQRGGKAGAEAGGGHTPGWLVLLPCWAQTLTDTRPMQLVLPSTSPLQVPGCAGPPHCPEQEGSRGHSSLEHNTEGTLLAKDKRLLEQQPCPDPACSGTSQGQLSSEQATVQVPPHCQPRPPPQTPSSGARWDVTCRMQQAEAGCDGPRLRCGGCGIFWGLE